MDNGTIKKNMESIRLSRRLSQEEMAEVLGIARNTYRNIEKGPTKLISETVIKFAEWAEVTPEEVVLGYLPVEDTDSTLKDVREKCNERIRILTEDYESRLEKMREKNNYLSEINKALEDNVRTLKSYIAILEKRAEEQKNV